MAILYLMCGSPGSGKSSYVQSILEEDFQKWVSRDVIRFSLVKENEPYFSKETLVFNSFVNEIVEGLQFGYDVFADATHLNESSRRKLLNRIPKYLRDETHAICIEVDVSVAVRQNEMRKGTRAYVHPTDLKRMFFKYHRPALKEGFDTISIVTPNRPILDITAEGEFERD